MINLNHRDMCENCFAPLSGQEARCPYCGFAREDLATRQPLALPIETILLGKYVIGKVLGMGGFGITYLAYDLTLNRRVAIKEYYPSALTGRIPGGASVAAISGEKGQEFERGARKFYEEAKMISCFNGNPNIISVYEFFYQNNTAYYVMEYLEGTDLAHYLLAEGRGVSDGKLLHLLDKVTDALMIVHSANLLHRDISPDNIFVCRDGNIKLIDFGSARQYMTQESQSLSVIVKPGFAPIEQYQKKGNQGPWTDIYALGATAYYMLTGRKPDNSFERVSGDTLSFTGIHPEIAKVLRIMLAVQPQKRFQSVFDLKRALFQIKIPRIPLVSTMVPTPPVPPVPPVPPTPSPEPPKPKKDYIKIAVDFLGAKWQATKTFTTELFSKIKTKNLDKKDTGILIGAASAFVVLIVLILALAIGASNSPELPPEPSTTESTSKNRPAYTQSTETTTAPIVTETGSTGLKYILNNGGNSYLVNGIGSCTDTELVIPETHDGLPVTRIGIDAFAGNERITSVLIPESVTGIGSGAFKGCINLRSVSLSNQTLDIGSGAFQDCTSLSYVSLPSTLSVLSNSLFSGCTNLRSIALPAALTSIGNYTFYGCKSLSTLTLPEGLKSIGSQAFRACASLRSITIPENVTYIGGSAFSDSAVSKVTYNAINCTPDGWIEDEGMTYYTVFYGCPLATVTIGAKVQSIPDGLFFDAGSFVFQTISIPENVQTIGALAFRACETLSSVTISNGLMTIEEYAFDGCVSLKTVNYTGTKEEWNAISVSDNNTSLVYANILCSDGQLRSESKGLKYRINADGKTYSVSGLGTCSDKDVVIPLTYDGLPVTGIDNYAFKGAARINSVIISTRITSIGEYAFDDCKNLKAVIIPDSVISIGIGAFRNCTNLSSIAFPNGINTIDNYMFFGCTSLRTISTSDDIMNIGDYAFYGCVSLSFYQVPNGVQSIGESAFAKCTALSSIILSERVTLLGREAFSGCTALEEISLPNGIMEIAVGTFYGCSSLVKVKMPESLFAIEKNAFYHCKNLAEITLPAGLVNIGEQAFIGCTALETVTIPSAVKTMGYWAFKGCTGLTSLIVREGVIAIGERTFSDCTALRTVTLPTSISRIENEAFIYCTVLETVYYAGSASQWSSIYIGSFNFKLTGANIVYNHR